MSKKIKKSYRTLEREIIVLRKKIEEIDSKYHSLSAFNEGIKSKMNKILAPESHILGRWEGLNLSDIPEKLKELFSHIKSLQKDIHLSDAAHSNLYHILRVALKDPTLGSEDEDEMGSKRISNIDAF